MSWSNLQTLVFFLFSKKTTFLKILLLHSTWFQTFTKQWHNFLHIIKNTTVWLRQLLQHWQQEYKISINFWPVSVSRNFSMILFLVPSEMNGGMICSYLSTKRISDMRHLDSQTDSLKSHMVHILSWVKRTWKILMQPTPNFVN